ncbi:MAG TPA: CzcE family metal-binding protein [Burkholderiaceae bacterium]|nr:CzcE family metal-binding protein [Burkholderiaceae bacterium]
MSSTKLIRTLILGIFSATIGTAAFATVHSGVSDALGNTASDAQAQRTIELRKGVKYANIEKGETVKFVSEGKSFTWTFDTLGTPAIPLAAIAPEGAHVGDVVVYVGPSSVSHERVN